MPRSNLGDARNLDSAAVGLGHAGFWHGTNVEALAPPSKQWESIKRSTVFQAYSIDFVDRNITLGTGHTARTPGPYQYTLRFAVLTVSRLPKYLSMSQYSY